MIGCIFYSKLKEEEIEYKISTLPELSLFEVSKRGNFCGDINKNRFCIGHSTDAFLSSYSYFCGKVEEYKGGSKIVGYFAPSLKIYKYFYGAICVFFVLTGGISSLFGGVYICIHIHLFFMILMLISTRVKRELISFIENDFSYDIYTKKKDDFL